MRKQVKPKKAVARGAGGRPRKYTDEQLVDAALRVMEREGYAALTIRSLATELGTSHPTLYNYIGHIGEIETKALHKLTERLPMPQASTAPELRAELMAYLIAARGLLLHHPSVMFPPVGSTSWHTLFEIGERWIRALKPHAPDEKSARLALGALVSIVVVSAQRDHMHGPDYEKQIRKVVKVDRPGLDTIEQTFDAMIEFVLPALSRTTKAGKPATRRSKAR